MAHITSLAIEKVHFNHFSILSLWKLSVAMATKPRGRSPNVFSYLELSLAKQYLCQISPTASEVLEELPFKKFSYLKFNVAKATKQNTRACQ